MRKKGSVSIMLLIHLNSKTAGLGSIDTNQPFLLLFSTIFHLSPVYKGDHQFSAFVNVYVVQCLEHKICIKYEHFLENRLICMAVGAALNPLNPISLLALSHLSVNAACFPTLSGESLQVPHITLPAKGFVSGLCE
jgi:hypothetical protein